MDAMRVDENKCKEREEKKDLLGRGCERVDALACGRELDADDCENKEEKKKRKKTLTGCRSWSRMVVDAWNAQMASSGGAVVMVASYLSSSYLISASILSNLGAHLISYLIYGCGLVSS